MFTNPEFYGALLVFLLSDGGAVSASVCNVTVSPTVMY